MSLTNIGKECRVCFTLVSSSIGGMVCDHIAQGRATRISVQELEAIRAARERAVPLHVLAKQYRTSTGRLKMLLAGTVKPDEDKRIPEDEEGIGPYVTWPPRKVLDVAGFKMAGVPDNAMNRNACKGRTRAWMRLYALRCVNPGYSSYGDAPEAIRCGCRVHG